jgi:hypothetical protein
MSDKAYRIAITTGGMENKEVHNFVIAADNLDKALAEAKSQLPKDSRVLWSESQRV